MEQLLVIQHMEHEDAGMFGETARHEELELRLVRTWLGESVPRTPGENTVAVLIMGGGMNVDQVDRYPNLAAEMKLVRQCVARSTPLIGVCLGSQLIAAALGARVYDGPVKEIGWYSLQLTEEAEGDPLFEGLPEQQTVFQWHGQTFDLPAGAVRLAGSEAFPNQAYRLGECIWGLQYHLETTEIHVRDWLARGGEDYEGLDYIQPERIIQNIPTYEPVCRQLAEKMFGRFIRFARNRGSGGR